MNNAFNANLKAFRKKQGITQNQLAEIVGVSPQAISKWEISGYPDAALLPVIASSLEVTIDELYFGDSEKNESANQNVVDYIRNLPRDDIFPKMFEICRAMLMGSIGCSEYRDISKGTLDSKDWEVYSQVTQEEGIMLQRLNENLQYFFLMLQPENGYDEVLPFDKRMMQLFKFLSNEDALRAMYFLAGQESSTLFTIAALTCELEITSEAAKRILDDMEKLNLICCTNLNIGNGKCEKVYQYLADYHFIAFIAFAKNLLNKPQEFNYQAGVRKSSYFKKDAYRKQKEVQP